MLNIIGIENIWAIQEMYLKVNWYGIFLFFGLDVLYGYEMLFLVFIVEASSWDLEVIFIFVCIIVWESVVVGVYWIFVLMVDVSWDVCWGWIMEGVGEDLYLNVQVVVVKVKGFQGDDLFFNVIIVVCVKYFVGYGFVEVGWDYNIVDMSC